MAGISMIELIMFIVIVGIGVVGILSVFRVTVKSSADPMLRKQAIAIAESLLTEIIQQPFTYCDPQDANVLTAHSAAECADTVNNDENNGGKALKAMPTGEQRGDTNTPFNNVADYNGFTQTNITDVTGTNQMTGYNARVTITRVGNTFPQAPVAVPGDAALKIDVTITYANGSETVTLTGYRFRYAPNAAG